MKRSTIFLLCIMIACTTTSTLYSMQIMRKHCAVTLGRQALGMRLMAPLVTHHNRFCGDKLGHGEFHPYNIPPKVLEFFVTERDSYLGPLKEAQKSLDYTWQDWITTKEEIKSYTTIKTILDMQIADDAAGTASSLQHKSKAIGHTLQGLEIELASIERSLQKHNAQCSEFKKRVETYDKILQKIQKKPC